MKVDKRQYHYVLNPKLYDMTCDICNGDNIEWSEFKHHIWCYECEKDTKGTGGIFTGPIPCTTAMILGYNFSLYDIANQKIIQYESDEWFKAIKEL